MKLKVAAVTFDPIVPLLMGLLIGLLVSLIVGSWWSARTHPLNLTWLTTHDRVMGVAADSGGVYAGRVHRLCSAAVNMAALDWRSVYVDAVGF